VSEPADRSTATADAVADAFFARDVPTVLDLLGEQGTFSSPAADYRDREQIATTLEALGRVSDGWQRTSTLHAPGETAARFTARVGGRDAEGVLHVIAPEDAGPRSMTLMIRPLDALIAGVRQISTILGRG
jgi:hypothetical protein